MLAAMPSVQRKRNSRRPDRDRLVAISDRFARLCKLGFPAHCDRLSAVADRFTRFWKFGFLGKVSHLAGCSEAVRLASLQTVVFEARSLARIDVDDVLVAAGYKTSGHYWTSALSRPMRLQGLANLLNIHLTDPAEHFPDQQRDSAGRPAHFMRSLKMTRAEIALSHGVDSGRVPGFHRHGEVWISDPKHAAEYLAHTPDSDLLPRSLVAFLRADDKQKSAGKPPDQDEVEEFLRDYRRNTPKPNQNDAWDKVKIAFEGRVPNRKRVFRPAYKAVFAKDFNVNHRGRHVPPPK